MSAHLSPGFRLKIPRETVEKLLLMEAIPR
jgi:hypothetical protein